MTTLHGYFRSSASYRVRIALNLKGVVYSDAFHHLRHGAQRHFDYLAINPQGLVPALEDEEAVLTQSLAICEYLDEIHPDPPLLPSNPIMRAKVRALAQIIACDTHPLQNLKVLQRLRAAGLDKDQVAAWARQAIEEGLEACSILIADQPGPYCFGDTITLADLFLVPQLANARRFSARLDWGRVPQIEAACMQLDAFCRAAPEAQPDCE
jgi:maleylpyruvate isomerase